MRLVSFNVNGIRAILNKDFDDTFYKLNADIMSLNETKLSEGLLLDEFIYNPPGYEVYYTNSKVKKGYSGVCIFTKLHPLSVHYGLLNGKYDEEGRSITLEFDKFYYVASYVPNAGDDLKRLGFRLEYEKDLIAYFRTLNKPIIYAGDLNVAHNEIDLKNPKANVGRAGFTNEERNAFSNLLNQGFIDTYRYLYPDKIEYSWWSYRFNARANNAGWRIDYFIVSKELKDKIKDAVIHTDIYGSDHCPVELNIDL